VLPVTRDWRQVGRGIMQLVRRVQVSFCGCHEGGVWRAISHLCGHARCDAWRRCSHSQVLTGAPAWGEGGMVEMPSSSIQRSKLHCWRESHFLGRHMPACVSDGWCCQPV
jgi:hypothetical protein